MLQINLYPSGGDVWSDELKFTKYIIKLKNNTIRASTPFCQLIDLIEPGHNLFTILSVKAEHYIISFLQ